MVAGTQASELLILHERWASKSRAITQHNNSRIRIEFPQIEDDHGIDYGAPLAPVLVTVTIESCRCGITSTLLVQPTEANFLDIRLSEVLINSSKGEEFCKKASPKRGQTRKRPCRRPSGARETEVLSLEFSDDGVMGALASASDAAAAAAAAASIDAASDFEGSLYGKI